MGQRIESGESGRKVSANPLGDVRVPKMGEDLWAGNVKKTHFVVSGGLLFEIGCVRHSL